MAVGDAAFNAGYPIVPDSGTDGLVRWGAREINRTRDLLAALKALVPTSKSAFRTKSGIRSGTSLPSDGNNGDIFLKIL